MATFKNYKTAVINGFLVAVSGTALMLTLLWLKLLGPKAISLDTEMAGGTILFLMLYLFLLFGIYFTIRKKRNRTASIFHLMNRFYRGLF